MERQNPTIYKLPNKATNIFNKKFKLSTSDKPPEQLLKYGFVYPYRDVKNKCDILNNINKKQTHLTNPYEHKIENYDEDINSITHKYFDIKDNSLSIQSRAFYKMWEIIIMFNVIDINKKKLKFACIAEAPGSFFQAIINFRNKFSKNIQSDDIYNIITLDDGDKETPIIKPNMIKSYKKINKNIDIYTSNNDNGDLTDIKTINNFSKEVISSKKYVDFVTADGGFIWSNENYQEQEAYCLILGEILTALKIQEKYGTFVLKIFESFTNVTLKLILILKQFYKDIHIYKPWTSRATNSEKYLVCQYFNVTRNKDFSEKIERLEGLLIDMRKVTDKREYISDITPYFELKDELSTFMKYINIDLGNCQYNAINKMISFVKRKKEFGEEKEKYIKLQKKYTQYWISWFYPVKSTDKAYNENQQVINKNKTKTLENNIDKINVLYSTLV